MGKKRLEDALKKIEQPVTVIYRCFELDPTMERKVNYNIYEKLASKYGMSIEQAKATSQNVVQMAKAEGLDFQMDTLVLANTFDAHRLTMFAKKQGLMNEMTDRLLRAYYTESKNIGDHPTLVELAKEVGLDADAAANILATDEMSEAVRADEQEASALGIRSIPFFLINKKYAITGAQSTDIFIQSLQKILEQDGPFTIEQEGVSCDDGSCDIPKS